MNFDEEEDEEDEDSSSSSQLNSNTRPGSATSKKSNKVRGEWRRRSGQAAACCGVSEGSRDGPGFLVLFVICTGVSPR